MTARSVALATLAALALTGCGSVPASVRDLSQDAGHICRRANHTFAGLLSPTAQSQDAAFLLNGAARLASELGQLRRLTPPRSVADVYQAALGALGQELTVLRQTASDIHQGQDPAMAYRTLKQRLGPLESQVDNAWSALQIADCLQ